MGNMRYLLKLTLQRAGNESGGTLKGTAVMVVQHTQPPFRTFFMQLTGKRGDFGKKAGCGL